MRCLAVPWLWTAAIVVLTSAVTSGQSAPENEQVKQLSNVVQELQSEVRQLREAVSELRQQSDRYRSETEELRRTISVAQVEAGKAAGPQEGSANAPEASATQQRLDKLEEEQQLLQAKVNEQHATKVESASKYRVRLSGIVLLNLFNNQGAVDNIDIPTLATYPRPGESGGSLGATMRQTLLGVEVFGPTVAGARTSADLQMDFGGGFPSTPNGITAGILRVRTASLHMNWTRSSLVGGQDVLFLAPEAPTSFASIAVPALSYSGNLWSWTPQLRFEHRFELSEQSRISVAAGVLDPLTGEIPSESYLRQPTAGENSRSPGAGMRAAWSHRLFGKELSLGAAGYYSKQDWGFNRRVNAWAGIGDWDIPFTHWLKLSGQFYRGSAIGGFGAGTGRSVVFSGLPQDAATLVRPLNTMGGWTQIKFLATPKLEFNGAAGQDNPFARDLRAFVNPQSYVNAGVVRNRTGFVNVVYRPRSDMLVSAEFRRLRTFEINNDSRTANQLNLAMGYLF